MKAAIYQGDKRFSIEEVRGQSLMSGDVRINVTYCGICGTDRHIYHGVMDKRVSPPQIIGHEMSGIIAEVGSDVTHVQKGDLVVVRPLDNRAEEPSDKGFSHICKKLKFIGIDTPGAMQESWVVPGFTVHKLPPSTDMKIAALTEPLAVACHDIERARLKKGETVVVIGGGPIGLLIAMVAQHIGAKVIVLEINQSRLNIAEKMGCIAINPSQVDAQKEIMSITNNIGVDVVFEVSGANAGVKIMTEIISIRGRIVMVAIHSIPQEVSLFQFFWKEIEMIGARVYEPKDYETAIQLISNKVLPLEMLITDVMPLSKIQQAFVKLDEDVQSIKILLDISKA